MIPKQTQPVMKFQKMNAFLNKHILFEYVNFYTNSQFYIEQNFGQFTTKMMKSFKKDDLVWNIFTSPNMVDVSYFDRESTMTFKSSLKNINKI